MIINYFSRLFFVSGFFLSTLFLQAQITTPIEEKIYDEKIKTVILAPLSSDMSLPIIDLNSAEKLLLRFDELEPSANSFRYKIQHCNADWSLSELRPSQYLDGFDDFPINTQQYSFNTIQRYVNYQATIPDEMTKLKVSGNYVLTVYREGEPDLPVFTRRFRIKENGMGIQAEIVQSSNVEYRLQQQEIQVSIIPNANYFGNPEEYVKVFVQQNGRRDQIRLLKLHAVRGNTYQYIWTPENIFNGGNEFRNVDIKNIKIRSRFVEKIDFIDGENQIYMLAERDKSRMPYIDEQDINGRFKIHSDFSNNSDIEGDYGWVHFLLPTNTPRLDGGFYIVGQLTDWYLDENSKMIYIDRFKAYIAAIYLKQGYYDYQVLFKPVKSEIGDESVLEGNHVETENEYTIYVYYRKPGDNYDRFIGISTINSRPNK